jgi:AraC family transcriptional regulator of adaptative response / DNA-3-methyladenine glycosylase II
MAVRAILGQQVSVAGARTLVGRLVLQFGTLLRTPVPWLTRHFPTASSFANATLEDMRKAGLTAARGATLLAVARAIADGGLALEPGRRIEEVLHELRKISGIGEWTAQYIVMRPTKRICWAYTSLARNTRQPLATGNAIPIMPS